VAALENPDLVQAAFEAKAHLKASELRYAAFEAAVPWRAVREHSAMESLSEVHDRYKVLLDELNVRSQEGGTVVECLERNQLGRFLQRGDAIATIAGDELILRLLLNERQFAAAQVRVGDRIRFRPRSRPTETIEAEVCCVEPAGTRAISTLSSEHVGRDGVQVDAQGNAAQPYFEIQARLRDVDHRMLARGSTGMARFESQTGEPLGLHIYRAITRFVNSLQAG
jgi:multidrug resistance efflux pump